MPDGANSKVRRGRKFDQVLAGAREVFMTAGFEGASVDEIARRAEVSKATLYSYFPDKRLLFMEVAKAECVRQADHAVETIDLSSPVKEVLTEAATQIMRFIFSDFGLRIFRICVAESERFPTLGAEFYESGPLLARNRLVDFFQAAVARGELAIDDFELAADQFSALCKSDLRDQLVMNVVQTVPEADQKRVIDGAVDLFMTRYGT